MIENVLFISELWRKMYVLGCPTVLHFNTAAERWRRLLIAQRLNNSSSLHPPYLQLSSSQIPPITFPSSTNLIYTHTPPTLQHVL